jgi:replication fork protection complex subunit Tof1/Swi1
VFKNNKLRLLMTLVGFERLDYEDIPGASYHVPSAVSDDSLIASLKKIQEAESTLSTLANYPDAKAPETYLKRKSTYSNRRMEEADAGLSTDSEGENSFDDTALFPAGGPTARKVDNPEPRKKGGKLKRRRQRAEVVDDDDEDISAKNKRASEKEKRAKIKSDLYVRDSDDETDEERDMEFFKKEDERRQAAGLNIAKAIATAQIADARKRKSAESEDDEVPVNKKKKRVINHDSDAGSASGTKEVVEISSDSSSSEEDTEQESETESTPISSLGPAHSPIANGTAQKEAITEDVVMADAEDESDEPVVKSQVRRNVRAGFVVDDSDSE